MALLRVVRAIPDSPTHAKLRQLMREYGLTRATTARLMRVKLHTVDRYLLPDRSKYQWKIPQIRWDFLRSTIQAIYHPDEPVEITL